MGDGMELEDEYALAVEAGLPAGWRVKNRGRKGSYYYDPEGKRYVNLTELQQALGGPLPDEIRLKPRKKREDAVVGEPATEFGLPEGWTVRRYTSKNVFFSPEGERFTSLKVALELLGAPSPSATSSKKPSLEDEEETARPLPASSDRAAAAAAASGGAASAAGAPPEEEEEPLGPQVPARKRGGIPSQFPAEPATELGLPDGWTVRKYNRKNVYFSPAGERFTSLVAAKAAAAAGGPAAAAAAAGEAAGASGSKRRAAAAGQAEGPSAAAAAAAGKRRRQAAAAPPRTARRERTATPERQEKRSAERGLALELGLPDGWRVRRRRTSTSFYCWDPDGNKFSKPKEVAASLGSLPEQLQRRWLMSKPGSKKAAGGAGSPSSNSSSTSSGSGDASDADPSAAPSAVAEAAAGSVTLQVEPAELRFLRGAHSQSRTVRLSNSSKHWGHVAFKVLTNITAPHNVDPMLGAMPPGGGKDVLITLHPRGGDDPNRDKHAFLFQAVPCESSEGVAKELWGKMDPKVITDVKLPIHWVDPPPKEVAPAAVGAAVSDEAQGPGRSAGSPPAKVEAPPAEPPELQGLPEQWEMHWSDEHQMYYYWNTKTEESRWTRPTL